MSLDKATVARIAHLARLRVPDSALEPLAKELSGILTWIEQLNEVDVAGVEPMTSVVEMALRTREDKATEGGSADEVLANAPETSGGYFVVPKVIE